ncbi:MAG: hypothetical protein AAGB04_32615 [Pseudomonadota bacterium]
MAQRDFAFVLTDKQEAQTQVSWIKWRYDNIANLSKIKVNSVTAALKVMLTLLQKGDTISDVRLFSHGSTTGGLQCRLRDHQSLGFVSPQVVAQFAKSSAEVKEVAKFADKQTGIHLLACNVAKNPSSLGAWVQVFSGGKGWACGPKGWLNTGLGAIAPLITLGGGTKRCPTRVFEITPKPFARIQTADQVRIDSFIDSSAAKNPPCIPPGQVPVAKQRSRDDIKNQIETYFSGFAIRRLNAELPASIQLGNAQNNAGVFWKLWDLPKHGHAGTPKRPAQYTHRGKLVTVKYVKAKTHNLNGGGGLIFPFISSEMLSSAQLAKVMTSPTLLNSIGTGKNAIQLSWPINPARWKNAFGASPNAPTNRTC